MGSPPAQIEDAWTESGSRRLVIAAAIAFVWIRVGPILSLSAFETPDSGSYRSGQGTRPPVSSAMLSLLGDTSYVALSAMVSSAGFLALIWSLWNPKRRRWSMGIAGVVAAVSFLPMVSVYEHWLVPDSLVTGLSLLAISFASRRIESDWYPWAMVGLCVVITLTKEVGFGVVILVALVVAIRGSHRLAGVAVVTSALLFVLVVLPASDRSGRVLWEQPLDTELSMERFRVIVNATLWPDLSTELAEVRNLAADCGMNPQRLFAETFRLTDQPIDYSTCPDLWPAVDEITQLDLLAAHLRNPVHLTSSVERGFAPDMYAMSYWSGYHIDSEAVMSLDQLAAVAVALVPAGAMVVALLRRRGRRLAAVALAGSAVAFVAALLDPSSQDRHTLVFRVAALAIGLIALTNATAANDDPDEITGSSRVADEDAIVGADITAGASTSLATASVFSTE
jgi:hypothetical protein